MIMKNGWLKTQVLPFRSAGVRRSYCTPSTDQVIESGAQSTANVWKSSANDQPFGWLYAAPIPFAPEYPGPWIVPCTVAGSLPMFSMMSISPSFGQLVPPSIQKAGQSPCPRGILIRASNRPYVWVNVCAVSSRADVYWHGPYQQLKP